MPVSHALKQEWWVLWCQSTGLVLQPECFLLEHGCGLQAVTAAVRPTGLVSGLHAGSLKTAGNTRTDLLQDIARQQDLPKRERCFWDWMLYCGWRMLPFSQFSALNPPTSSALASVDYFNVFFLTMRPGSVLSVHSIAAQLRAMSYGVHFLLKRAAAQPKWLGESE